MIAPGTSHALAFDLDPLGPPALRLEITGFYLRAWTPDEDRCLLVSHTLPIGEFDGPIRSSTRWESCFGSSRRDLGPSFLNDGRGFTGGLGATSSDLALSNKAGARAHFLRRP